MEALKALKHDFDAGKISKADYDKARIEAINSLTGTKKKSSEPRKGGSSKSSGKKAAPKAARYGDVSPRKDAPESKFGASAQNARVAQGTKLPGDGRLKHTPQYPFGKDKAQVGDADALLAYLESLDEKLDGVETYHEKHKKIQASLPRQVKLGKMPRKGGNEAAPSAQVKPDMMMQYAKDNDVKNLQMMMNLGIPVDFQDRDTHNTPLMSACSAGQRQAMFFLVEKGANVNHQNLYGSTPLHELIKNKRENLAIWLIKHGADIYLEDKRTYSPYDLALPWFQVDMKKCAADVDITQRYQVEEQTQTTFTLNKKVTSDAPRGVQSAKPIKIFFQNDSYKTVFAEPGWTAGTILEKVAEKIGMDNKARYLQLLDHQKGREKRLPNDTNILQAKAKWPLIVGKGGSDTDKFCRFICIPRSDAPAAVIEDYAHYTKNG